MPIIIIYISISMMYSFSEQSSQPKSENVCQVFDSESGLSDTVVCPEDIPDCCTFGNDAYCCKKNTMLLNVLLTSTIIFVCLCAGGSFTSKEVASSFDITSIWLFILSYFNCWRDEYTETPELFTEKSALKDYSYLLRKFVYFDPPKSESDSLENYTIVDRIHTDRWNNVYLAVMKGNFNSKYVIRKYLNVNIKKYNLQKDLVDKQRLLVSLNYCQYASDPAKCTLFPETKSVFYDENRNLYFVQEFVAGIELSTVMTDFPNGLPETAVMFISAQVLLAMEYLHRSNILVRDIHANGIIVQRNGFIRICSMSFGEVLEIDYTSSKSMKGRVAFFPPEFFVKRIWTKEADCWCFGIFVYHLSFGKTPFESERGVEKTIAGIYLNRYSIPVFCSFWLRKLIRGLLCSSIRERINTAEIASQRWFSSIDFQKLIDSELNAPLVLLSIVNR